MIKKNGYITACHARVNETKKLVFFPNILCLYAGNGREFFTKTSFQRINLFFQTWLTPDDNIALNVTSDPQNFQVHQAVDLRDDHLARGRDLHTTCYWLPTSCNHVVDSSAPWMCTHWKNCMTGRHINTNWRKRVLYHKCPAPNYTK